STAAQTAVHIAGAVFKGLAVATFQGAQYLYAADFHNGKFDVFNHALKQQMWGAAAFRDVLLPKGYAPFNIQALRGALYVTYAKQDADKHDDAARLGRGWVDVYTNSGKLIKRLVKKGVLDSPWGLAIAPAGWGKYTGALLVGNFGNGRSTPTTPVPASSSARSSTATARCSASTDSGVSWPVTASPVTSSRSCSRPARATRPTACTAS
ncbi:MAG: hypothetical protein QOE76_2538, partial [Frankiales bacterium]|nr:hypothetical protein [Frankiales bacterium]